ncbi:DsbA family protein [Bartonella sp. B10]
MTYKHQYSKITFIIKFLAILNFLICTPSSNAISKENTQNYLNTEDIKKQLLEDSTFLSQLKEKVVPYTSDHDIQKIVKDYLLENPEIMIQMQLILQEKLEKKFQKQASIINSLKKEIFQSSHDAVLGNPNGKIMLVDFFDYNCKHCKSSYSHIESLIKKYPDLRVVIKDLPSLGSDSKAVHAVAYAFRKEFPQKYPKFHKELLANQDRINEAQAIKIAISLGADKKKLQDAMKDPDFKNSFRENIRIASALNITGIPSYIIGDKVFIGAVSENTLEEAIKSTQ